MKSAVFTADGRIELMTQSLPSLPDNMILVRIEACGICTWEQRIFKGEKKSFILL